MIEAIILSIVMCSPNAMDITQCQNMISRNAYATEQECVIELMEQALPWVISQDMVIMDFTCGPYDLPFSLDDPA